MLCRHKHKLVYVEAHAHTTNAAEYARQHTTQVLYAWRTLSAGHKASGWHNALPDLNKVDARPLSEALHNEARLEAVDGAVLISLDAEDPLRW